MWRRGSEAGKRQKQQGALDAWLLGLVRPSSEIPYKWLSGDSACGRSGERSVFAGCRCLKVCFAGCYCHCASRLLTLSGLCSTIASTGRLWDRKQEGLWAGTERGTVGVGEDRGLCVLGSSHTLGKGAECFYPPALVSLWEFWVQG